VIRKRKSISISSDLKKLSKMTEADIDYSDISALDKSFFKKEIVVIPQKRQPHIAAIFEQRQFSPRVWLSIML
jgi:hypothetical protein